MRKFAPLLILLLASTAYAQSYTDATRHRHRLTITSEFRLAGLSQRGPMLGVEEQFFGNTLLLKTAQGRSVNLWCDFSRDIVGYFRLSISAPNTILRVTYDPECGMVTHVEFGRATPLLLLWKQTTDSPIVDDPQPLSRRPPLIPKK